MHPDKLELYYNASDGSWILNVRHQTSGAEYVTVRSQSFDVVKAVLRAVEDDFWSHTRGLQIEYRRMHNTFDDDDE